MNENKIIAFFILLFSGIVFIVLSFLVRITRGKNKTLLSVKIKTGIQIMIVSGLLAGLGCQGCITKTPLCYVTVQVNAFEFKNIDENQQIAVLLDEDRIIYGRIYYRYAEKYTFHILNTEKNISVKGVVLASDGSFDSEEEDIMIEIPETIGPGLYKLLIYDSGSGDKDYPVYSGYIDAK